MRHIFAGPLLALLLLLPASAEAAQKVCVEGRQDGSPITSRMVRIDGGLFTMGADMERPEENAPHLVQVSAFWIDRYEVTNRDFAAFVEATGHSTVAERGLDPVRHPGLPTTLLAPGSMVFSAPQNKNRVTDPNAWWSYVADANWRAPLGPGSSIEGLENHPVVHVAYEDALAYAKWMGRDLPTEAEWEFAARGGLEGKRYPWGDSYDLIEGWKANTWQGAFPATNTQDDGYRSTAPVGCFPPNGYGLHDMAGNVWEYARDLWAPGHSRAPAANPTGPSLRIAHRYAGATGPSVVIKGGSWLCAPNFCQRYRPSARQPQELSLGSNHIGFRTVLRERTGTDR
ncbi:formylglycine-generating enzyme family protein [Nisaea sp.]|uniref:formylglycine-generating enzyme family protein n=2 Tax=Alphaproteobacteria TaxID=28211 RepID=UPI003263684B